jgi:general nucleoside transport system permease protein
MDKQILMKPNSILIFRFLAVVFALLFTSFVLLIAGAPPFSALWNIFIGAFGTTSKIADVMVTWVPLILVTSGLLITFTSGLWNIGVEGQITIGAIFATGMMRILIDAEIEPGVTIFLTIISGMLGGAIWACLAGVLKTFGGVNEIFGGLGLNFVANALTIYFIFGPWKRPGTGSMSGTEPFPEIYWMPQLSGLRLSVFSVLIALIGIVFVFILLKNTYFGLRLKAIGKNRRASSMIGIPTARYLMLAFLLCGMYAGIAGGLQVVAVYHRLIPSISSGYGYLGLLVAMLTNYQAIWTVPVAFFFAALNIGSIRLPIILKLDSTLSGILQGSLVLFVIIFEGLRNKITKITEKVEEGNE